MDPLIQPIATELLKYGLPGIAILGLSLMLWQERKDRRDSQEARFADLRSVLEHVGAASVAMEKMAVSLDTLKSELMMARRR